MRQVWIAAQGLFGVTMLSASITFSSVGAILLFSMMGFSWAASVWIPFALLGEETSSGRPLTEQDAMPLTAAQDYTSDDEESGYDEKDVRGGGRQGCELSSLPGLVYGMHNVSIAFPQILVTLGMGGFSLLFSKGNSSASSHGSSGGALDEGVNLAWVLRLGGVFGLVAMFLATGVRENGGNRGGTRP